MEIISRGDRIGTGRYILHSRFRRAVNFRPPGNERQTVRLVSLVPPETGAGPFNLVCRGPAAADLQAIRIESREIILQGRRYRCGADRVYDSGLDIPRSPWRLWRAGTGRLEATVVDLAPPLSLAFLLDSRRLESFRLGFERAFARRVARGAEMILAGDMLEGVRRLKGSGFGLTPSGDDFLAGLLIGLHVRAIDVDESTRRTILCEWIAGIHRAAATENVFSALALEMARQGRVTEKLQCLIRALGRGRVAEIGRCARDVLATGHTSGADLLTGLIVAMRLGRERLRQGVAVGPAAPDRRGWCPWS
jgi:hypothetical protein